nr:hypothetical protein [Arthrobacter terrae]
MLGTVCFVVAALARFLAPSLADTSAAIFVLPEIICEVSPLAYRRLEWLTTSWSMAARTYLSLRVSTTAPRCG